MFDVGRARAAHALPARGRRALDPRVDHGGARRRAGLGAAAGRAAAREERARRGDRGARRRSSGGVALFRDRRDPDLPRLRRRR